jgi:hypothetical protein
MQVPRLQAEDHLMAVIIRKSMGSWLWTCQTCGHTGVASTPEAAKTDYERHKKTAVDH